MKMFRVACSGQTIDNRTITPEMLKTAAKNFSEQTYPVSINLEHISGYTGEPPFFRYGKVTALEAREEELQFGDKKEKVTTLWAALDVHDALVALNKAGQKLYTSIELWQNFRGREGQFCLGGLAITDTPASFATDELKFAISPVEIPKAERTDPYELVFAAADAQEDLLTRFFSKLAAFTAKSDSTSQKTETPPITPPVTTDAPANQFATFMAEFTPLLKNIGDTISANSKSLNTLDTRLAALENKFADAPKNNFTPRTKSTGIEKDNAVLADC